MINIIENIFTARQFLKTPIRPDLETKLDTPAIEGQEVEQALVGSTGEQDFKYLGSWVDSKD